MEQFSKELKDLGGAAVRGETSASQPKSIGDDAQFQRLLENVQHENHCRMDGEDVALIAYIDNFRAPAAQASATIQAPVMVAEPVRDLKRLLKNVSNAEYIESYFTSLWAIVDDLRKHIDLAAPMVADPAGVADAYMVRDSHHVVGIYEKRADAQLMLSWSSSYQLVPLFAATVKAVPSEALTEKEIDFVQRVLASPGNKLNGEGESTDYSEGAAINALWKRPEERNVVIVMGSYKWRVNPRLAKEVSDATRHIIANFAAPLADKTGGGD